MENKQLIRIYEQALEDWNVLQEKFNGIDDKSINNIKRVFADHCEERGLFFAIKHGSVEAYLSDCKLEEPFTIKIKDDVQPYVYVEEIKKRIELLTQLLMDENWTKDNKKVYI